MAAHNYNKWDGQPRLLSDEEIANPMGVVHEVFDYAHLPDLRNTLWEWLKTTVSGNFNKKSLDYRDRESLLAFYEKMQKLLEAAHLLLVAKNLIGSGKKITLPFSSNNQQVTVQKVTPATELVPIVEQLVDTFSPEFLFEMGSLQKECSSTATYFFLLVLPDTSTLTYAVCNTLAESACKQWGTVQIITVKIHELQKYLNEGNLMYSIICTEDALVYAKEGQSLHPVNTCRLTERIAAARAILDTALTQAQSFYEGAVFYFQQPNYPLAVFLLQQALEHCLRGFLEAITGRNTISHDLVLLRRSALPFFPALLHLLPVEEDQNLCLLHQVSKAYVQARYERDFSMPVTEIDRLKSWVEALLPATLQAFEQWVGKGLVK